MSSFYDNILKLLSNFNLVKEALRKYGLTEKEIETYLACLKSGSASAYRLSELTNIRRSTIYEVLASLGKKGLIGAVHKKNKYYFTAAKPDVLINLLRDKEKAISEVLPLLTRISGTVIEKPKVEVFEGVSGIKSSAEDMLNYQKIIVYGASRLADSLLGTYNANFARRRVEKHIQLQAVIEEDVPSHMLTKEVRRYTDIRTLHTFKNHNSVYFIFGKKVMIMTFKDELIAIRITSQLLVESQTKIFQLLWEKGKPVRRK